MHSGVDHHIRPDDAVIELGSHEGVTTDLIRAQGCKFVLGVDASEFNVSKALKRYGNTENLQF